MLRGKIDKNEKKKNRNLGMKKKLLKKVKVQ